MQMSRPAEQGAAGIQLTTPQGETVRRVEDLRGQRQRTEEGGRTIIREPDRVIIRESGRSIIRHNEVERFRYNARDVRVENRGSETVTVVERPDGTRVITVLDAHGNLVRRARRTRDGREIVIIQNSPMRESRGYYVDLPPARVQMPRERYIVETQGATAALIYDTLAAPPIERLPRRYSLDEVRYSASLRERMPRVDIDTVTFESGSWVLSPDQIDNLGFIAEALNRAITQNPREVFLIEGHTDAVGAEEDNLSLSDRRAETAAIALAERYGVPAENLVTQGYGEQQLKIPTDQAERQNRRVTIRRITPLLAEQQ
jgi:outer membrane protein OmpA-like peptidoglycan-associated protein